jgi:hypothetical protein
MAAAGNETYVKTNKTKRYDIFKNTLLDIDVDTITNLLANLSVADTSHDIDKKDKGVPHIKEWLNDDTNIHAKMYKKGIPVPYIGKIFGEEQAISAVIDSSKFNWISQLGDPVPPQHNALFKAHPYVPLRVMKYIKEGRTTTSPPNAAVTVYSDPDPQFKRMDKQQHSITTINHNEYTVTYFDVKPGEERNLINARNFFSNMGYENLESNINIAFVVDCTSITIEDILNNGPNLGANFKTYLIKSPEGENDPGGKTNLQDKTFKNYNVERANTGVRYRAAVPFDLKKSNSYSYSFKEINTSPYTQFFTNYNFELSELQFDDKFIFSELTTKLNIIDPNSSVPPKLIPNSGNMNKIGAVSTIIRNIMDKISKYSNKASDIDVFYYNCALQQKRAGDWLQALLTCLVASGERKFCEYNSPNFDIMGVFKKKNIQDGVSHDALVFKEENVYLVTHDRILLAFALLLGINVIFTHHFSGSEGQSYHSTLLYKITNPLERGESKIVVMNEFYEGVKTTNIFNSQLTIAHDRLNKIYTYFTNEVNKFICGREGVCVVGVQPENNDNLQKYINEFSERIIQAVRTEETAISGDIINQHTQKIFAMAFKIALIKTTFPDLDNLDTDITAITQLKAVIQEIKGKLKSSFNEAKHPEVLTVDDNDSDYFLKYTDYSQQNIANKLSYENIVEYLSKYHAIISKINKFTEINKKYNEFIANLNKHLKKNPTFGLILAWRTANVPKCNLWVQYNNVLEMTSAYINDKNIFLYELANLDDDSKEKICNVYLKLFNTIKIPANVAGSSALQAKLQQNVLSFCLEVFINLGPFVKNEGERTNIKIAIDSYLVADTIQIVPPEDVPYNNSVAPVSEFILNRFSEVIKELNALNSTKTEDGDTEITVNIPSTDQPLPVTTYQPLLTPMVIEELIEMKVNAQQGTENNQDVTGPYALPTLRLDVPIVEGVSDEKVNNPTINLTDIEIPRGDNLGIADVTFYSTVDELPPSVVQNDPQEVLTEDVDEQADGEQDGGEQVGGRIRRYQDISFIFDNKMAPRYLAATDLFRNYPSEDNLIYISDRLSGAHRIVLDAANYNPEILIPPAQGPLSVRQDDLDLIGGAHEEIESLLSSEESILVNEKFAPHPLLSIYLTLESYCTELDATSIKDSWDYENFVQFFEIANAMINNLLKIYSGDNNNNTNKLKACMVGYGLRELIFTSPQYIERTPICIDALDIKLENYNPLSKMFSIFVNRVCGSVNQTPEDIALGSKYISNTIFKEYATRNGFNRILDSDVPDVDTYQLALKSNELFLEVGRKIISDTNGTENNTLLELTENNPLPIANDLEEVPLPADVLVETPPSNQSSNYGADILAARAARAALAKNQGKGIPLKQKIADNTSIHTISDYKSEKPSLGIIQYVTSPISQGGKQTRKNKKYLKNKLTRGKARKYKNRTKKHRSIKHKLNKKLNKRSKRNRKYN